MPRFQPKHIINNRQDTSLELSNLYTADPEKCNIAEAQQKDPEAAFINITEVF